MALTLHENKMAKIYERDYPYTKGTYHLVSKILSKDDYFLAKKYSRQTASGKYLVILIEEIRDNSGMSRTERNIEMFETNDIRLHKSFLGVIFFVLALITALTILFAIK